MKPFIEIPLSQSDLIAVDENHSSSVAGSLNVENEADTALHSDSPLVDVDLTFVCGGLGPEDVKQVECLIKKGVKKGAATTSTQVKQVSFGTGLGFAGSMMGGIVVDGIVRAKSKPKSNGKKGKK